MKKPLDCYRPVAEAITALLFPHAEIVLHNLKKKCIEAIYNNFSKRNVGDASLIEDVEMFTSSEEIIAPYIKTNWDGRKIKSITAVLRDEDRKAIGLFCINMDISEWEHMHTFILDFIKPSIETPNYLFKNDWKEKINTYVSNYVKQHARTIKSLTKAEKQQLLLALQDEGAFETTNAAPYIAEVLHISRATVYNYLRSANATSSI